MSDENLKWSEYDFTKTPYDDLVRVGQRTMLYRDIKKKCQWPVHVVNEVPILRHLGILTSTFI